MRAGIARRGITPELGVELGGYPYVERANTGVHDELVATALYLESDGAFLVIATDLFWITRTQGTEIRTRIEAATGLPVSRMAITCSHTHSAPWMGVVFEGFPGRPFATPVDDDYLEQALLACTEAGVEAVRSATEAKVGVALARCGAAEGIGGNRRNPDGGPVDEDLPLLCVADPDGTLRAVWTKYALHPTILQGDNVLVSADFPGSLRAEVEGRCDGVSLLYSMGTAGDQSPRWFRKGETFDETERFGRTLAAAVVESLDDVAWLDEPGIDADTRVIDLPVKQLPKPEQAEARVAELRAQVARLEAEGAEEKRLQTARLWLLGAECEWANSEQVVTGRIDERYREASPYEVAALRVGNWGYAFLPGEVFCEYGLAIKERSPWAATHVVTLTNGHLPGYCVTQEALDEGGYEPGNSILAAAAGPALVDAATELLQQLLDRKGTR